MIWPAAILDLPARGAHEGSRVGTKGWAPQGAKQKDKKERKKKCCCSKLVLDIESPIQGRLRRRCLPPHNDLPHAQGRHTIPGSRCRSFRSPLEGSQGQTPHQPTRKAWLRRQAH